MCILAVSILPALDLLDSNAFISQEIFGSTGKFGMYGAPTDVKIKKVQSTSGMTEYVCSFTTLTPAMRER